MLIFLATLFIIICILLVVVVLLQKGRGGGLGSALGGGSASSAFGARTGDVFTWVTIVLTGLFLMLAIVLTVSARPEKGTVPPPRFRPPEGAITVMKRVTMSVPGDKGNTKIYYTTDERDPTEESKLYRRIQIKVLPGTMLKARAYRTGWRPSAVAVSFYGRPEDYKTREPKPATTPAATQPATAPATAPTETAPADGEPATRPAAATRGAG